MECYENGIITKEDTGGLDIRFGNSEAMVKLTEMIGKREGLGEILAEGTVRAAKHFGKDASRYAINVKGQEVPMHEPRLKKGLGLGYAISPTGADHCHNIHDTVMDKASYEHLKPLGIYEEAPIFQLTPEKVRVTKTWIEMRVAANSLSICQFPPWRFNEYVELLNAVTGWGASMHELVLIAQRTLNLARIFNLREGFRASDDWLPDRFFESQTTGNLSKTTVDKAELSEAIKTYYGMMGWNEEGIPRRETLELLGIGWAYEKMK
jgi:aldehyde:ferredoxin oxidoreductase